MAKKSLFAFSVVACAVMLVLVGCASGPQSSVSSVASDVPSSAEQSSETTVGVPDPWHDVSSARDAAAGAGIDGFSIPEGEQISLGPVVPEVYRYMEGLAEARVPFPAVDMLIRKGFTKNDGDLSGDYNVYAHTWTQNINGIDVTCAGNREGESTKTIWTVGDYSFCISVQGLGGDDDYGLRTDDLNVLVSGIM